MWSIAASLQAQVKAAPDSSARARADSIARADSVPGVLPQAEVPLLTEIGMSHRWNRDSLFSTGAYTLADFLDRVPGLSTLRARFYLAPQVGAYNGDVGKIRLFLDGIELESLDQRGSGAVDLTLFPIASLEELVVERGANELRLHMRSWRGPQVVTAQTRADVLTGDNRSNTFRGYLARRAHNGFAVQAMLQQRSTDDRQLGGDGDATTVFTRVGIVKPRWSVDATLVRVRQLQQTLSIFQIPLFTSIAQPLPTYEQVQREAYLRFGLGDVARGGWLQLTAASRQHVERSPFRTASATLGFAADSADTTTTSTQLVASVGWSSARARASFTERLRRTNGRTLNQPSARAGIDLGRLAVAGYVERNPFLGNVTGDVFVRMQATPWLATTGAAAYGTAGTLTTAIDSTDVPLPVAKSLRGEVALRVKGLWLQGGAVVRDSAVLRAPTIFNRTTPIAADGRAIGLTYQVVGPLWRGFSLHLNGVRWNSAGLYRPQFDTRSELAYRYHWKGASGAGGFRLLIAGTAEYRTRAFFPKLEQNDSISTVASVPATPLGLRLELTIRDATVTAQVRNLMNLRYSTVPGLLMPGALTTYGVRWSFWN